MLSALGRGRKEDASKEIFRTEVSENLSPGARNCSERKLQAELGGERNAYGGAGAEEVAEGSGGYAELVDAGDGSGLCAGGVEAEGAGVGEAVDGSGERGDVADVIVARVLAVEQIEEFGE